MARAGSCRRIGAFLVSCAISAGSVWAATPAGWPQWRGPTRDGVAAAGPTLATQWPSDGPPVVWEVKDIPAGGDGGYASPVIAGGRVYLFVNHRYAVPIQERKVSDETLRNLGWQKEMPAKDLLDAVEAARMSDERKAMKEGKAIDEWTTAWAKSHLPDEKEFKRLNNYVRDRLRRGADAVPLEMFDKLSSVKNKPFDSAAAFDKWLDEQQITDNARKQVLGAVPKDVRKVDDRVICVDAKSGKPVWERKWPGNGEASSTLCIDDGKCYGLTSAGEAFCLDAASGKDVWRTKARGGHSSFLIAGGRAIVLNDELTAFDAKTGTIVWKQPKVRSNETSPISWKSPADGAIYLLCNSSGGIACVALEDGTVKWTAPGGSPSTVATSGDFLAVLTDKSENGLVGYRITPQAATRLWNVPKVTERGSSPIIHDGHVYAVAGERTVCVKVDSGEVAWEGKPGKGDISSPVLADGKIFAALSGRLAMIGAGTEKFELLSKVRENPAQCASPAIADGRLVLRTNEGLKCFDLTAQGATRRAKAE